MENLVSLQRLSVIYGGKKVLVTGHTGFKGSWLIACLNLLGADVKGYALAPEQDYGLFNLLEPDCNIKSVIADIRDKTRLTTEIISFRPDYIFHLAAQPLVRRSYQIPAETFEVNVIGTANLLEAAGKLPGPCTIVIITTDKVYENKESEILYKENDKLGGYDPYSASKACAEIVVDAFRQSFFNPAQWSSHQKAIASARAGNVIGGGDWNRDRIIPDIINALENNKTISVRNPGAVRPWQHVLEPLAGYLLLGEKLNRQPLQFSKPFNFGPLPEDHLTVKELVDKAIRVWGIGKWEDNSDPAQPHEAGLLKLDISRARQELGWNPKLNAAEAIQWTVNWYKQPPSSRNRFTFQQIREYFTI